MRFIVSSGAGGAPDFNARTLAAELSRQMGQQFVVDNRPGAG
jgi:tripartite-type tricarboxylate transporter receptor subunit TctC